MSTAVATRTLVKTTVAGWFIDAADPDGPRVRKTPEDTIITREDYNAQKTGQSPTLTPENAEDGQRVEHRGPPVVSDRAPKVGPDQSVVISGTGKLLVGPTVTILCKWVPEEHQNAKVKALYAKDQREVTVEMVEKAAGVPACRDKRIVKVQDAFQAKFCDAHQDENRKAIRRAKAKSKRAAKK